MPDVRGSSQGAPSVSLVSLVRRVGPPDAKLDAHLSETTFRFREPRWGQSPPKGFYRALRDADCTSGRSGKSSSALGSIFDSPRP
jgi:hypothetical protein